MDIKGINGLYSYRPVSNLPKKNIVKGEAIHAGRDIMEGDKVLISSNASFKAKLDGVSKTYALEATEHSTVSSARMSMLKQQYKDDQIPVASQDVASAIMSTVLGRR